MRSAFTILLGALVLLAVLNTKPINGTAYFAISCAVVGFAQGYAVRMTIVTVMGLATFGVVAAVFGWLGTFARQRGFLSPQRS